MAAWTGVIRVLVTYVQNKVSVSARTEGSFGTHIITPTGTYPALLLRDFMSFQDERSFHFEV